jgi:Flp pilus assembly pilin Flp
MVQVPRRDRDAEGQGLAEYAFLLSLIAVIAAAAVVVLGTTISSLIAELPSAL